jgi:hypothetical protein
VAKNPLRKKIESHAQGRAWIEANAADMREIYSTVRARMMARIAEQATSGKVGVPFSGKHLVALSETIQRQYADLEQELRARMRHAVPYVAQSYYAMALAGAGSKVVGGFSKTRVDAMLQDSFSHIAGATRMMQDADIRHLRNVAAKIFRESSITGDTRRQVSQRLMSEAIRLPDFAFVDKAGRRWGNKSYFDMLGRTVLLNASRSSYLDTCADKGKDVVVVSTSGAPCPKCQVWERRLLSVTGNTPGLPTVEQATQAGLFHPNCTHSITAVPDVIRKRRYDDKGRPTSGWNSRGQAATDDADAWRKYRKENTKTTTLRSRDIHADKETGSVSMTHHKFRQLKDSNMPIVDELRPAFAAAESGRDGFVKFIRDTGQKTQTEYSAVWNVNGNLHAVAKGGHDAVSSLMPGPESTIIHNHPNNAPFSGADIRSFFDNSVRKSELVLDGSVISLTRGKEAGTLNTQWAMERFAKIGVSRGADPTIEEIRRFCHGTGISCREDG